MSKDADTAGRSRTVARERDHKDLRCPSVDTHFVTSMEADIRKAIPKREE